MHALQYELPGIVESLKELGCPDSAAQFDTFLRIFTTEINNGAPVILVADNLQDIVGSPGYSFLEYLVDADLNDLCVFAVSNTSNDIDLLARNNHKGSFFICDSDLALTPDEIRTVFETRGIDISDHTVQDVHDKTEGWPLPVYLMATQPAASKEALLVPANMDLPPISRIFENNFFAGYSQDIRTLLIKLSLLNEFSVEIIKQLAGQDTDIAEIVQVFEHNMFVHLDRSANMFSFQAMYKGFLAEKAAWLAKSDISRVHSIAGDYFLKNNRVMEAIDAYGQSENYPQLLEAVKAGCGLPPNRSLVDYLLRQLSVFPLSFAEENPMVDYLRASLYLQSLEFDKAGDILHALAKKFSGQARHKSMLGEVYILLAALSLINMDYSFADYYKKAAGCLPHGSAIMSKNTLMIENSNTLLVPKATPGSLDKMVQLFHKAAPDIEHVMNGGGRGLNLLFSAEAFYHRFDLENATEQAYQCIYRAQENSQHDLVLDAYQLLAKIAMLRGNYSELRSNIDIIGNYIERHNLPSLYYIRDLTEAWFYTNMGELTKIAPWILDLSPPGDEHAPIFSGYEKVIHPQFLMIQERYHEAIALLDTYEEHYKKRGLWSAVLTSKITRAIAYHRMGNNETASKNLWHAYEMTYANGVITPFIEFAKYMRTLVDVAHGNPAYNFEATWLDNLRIKSSSYSKRLLSMIRHHHSLSSMPAGPHQPKLSKREKEILQYLSQGMTREEIADFLCLSVNTVKSTIQNTYTKLNAVNRADAVRIATSLGLIEN